MPQVMVIVLNWNGLTDTLECLESLSRLDYPACELVVVDNGSTDGSPAIIRVRFPDVTLVETGENLGFTGGNNLGLRRALEQGADYALLLNNDTEVAPDFLRLLVEAAEADPRIGIVGPTIYYHAQPQVIWSAGGHIDWRRGRTWMLGLNEFDVGQFGDEPRDVDFVTGCALLVKRAVMEQVGLLDERFFAYYEETEWCVRARRAGFHIAHVPRATVWHKMPLDGRESSPSVHYYMTRNRLLFLKATGASWWVRGHVLFVEYLRRLIVWSVRSKWRSKKAQRRAMIEAINDSCRKRWGQRGVS